MIANIDDWFTVHHSITLAVFQLDAQNSYLFTYNIFIKILYIFRPEAAYVQLWRRPPEDEQDNTRNM